MVVLRVKKDVLTPLVILCDVQVLEIVLFVMSLDIIPRRAASIIQPGSQVVRATSVSVVRDCGDLASIRKGNAQVLDSLYLNKVVAEEVLSLYLEFEFFFVHSKLRGDFERGFFFLSNLFPQRLIRVDCELADHPYFTRSKGRSPADMTGSSSSDQDGLGLVTIPRDEPEASEGRDPIPYNEHIANLMQQMANMQREIDRLRNLTNLSISLNTPLPKHGADATIPPVDSPSPQDFLSNPSPFKTNMTAPKQPVNQPQVNFANINSQQTNPLPFTTPYVSQTPVLQTTLTQAPLTETNPLTQKAPLTQNNPLIQKYQTIQHIPVTHTTTPNIQYVPQVYVTEAQPFVTPIPTMPEVDPYEEMERKARSKTDESVAREIRNLKEAFKSIQLHKECEGLEYEDLCVHSDVELPAGYKVPKFDVFDRKGNPRAHLRSYCDKLFGVGKDEAIRMKLFIRSLTGKALDWYTSQDPKKWHSWSIMAQDFMDRFKFNTEAIPDRFYLMKLEKKSTESFREYAMRWRADAAKVQPPMTESEMTSLFIQSQKDATYYENMISVVGQKFFEVVRMAEFIEEGIKTGRITNLAALQATSKAIQSDSIGGAFKKKKDGVSAVMTIQEHTENCLTLKDKIEALIKEGVIQLRGAAPNVNNNPLPNHENVNMITIDEECNLEGTILPIKEEKNVMASAFIAPIITIQARAPFEVEVLDKGKGKVVVEAAAAGMTRSGRCYAPEGVARVGPNKEVNPNRVVTEAEIEDFWRKMTTKEYSVVEHLRKTPAQISLMSLLMSFETHRSALVKVLNEAYVPAEITSENLSAMVGQVLEANKVCFHEEELPSEVIGEIDLPLQIGPEEFVVEFQVLDIPTSYNLLLGRPWIHMAGAVPSTLHQNLKFVWNHHEIIVHGEGSNSMYPGSSIPVVEIMEELDGFVFHTKEIMCVHQTERVKLPRVLMMVAWEMLKNGFMPGRGLGVNLGGIVEPIQLSGQKYTFGLGYKPTPEEVSLADLKRKSDISLPHPIPHLNQSFSKAYIIKESEEDAEDTLVEGLKNLFMEEVECNMSWRIVPRFRPYGIEQINESANTENVTCNEMSKQISNTEQSFAEYEEEVQPEELTEDFEHFENKIKPNLDEIETMDVFAWSYDDMPGLSTNIVSHKLPTDPSCPPVKQKPRKIKPDLSLKVKKEVSKQIDANVIRVIKYPTWLANIVPVLKKDGKIRVCVDYRDLNKASPKDDFPLPNIHILIDNCAKHELQSFVDCFAGYHQILMDEEDADKTTFITPWGVYCYRVMPFGLKNAGATYMRAMTTIFHDMIHKEIEVYVDDVIIKSQKSSNHLTDLKKFFDRLRRYNLKLNPAKCAFGVPAGKLLGFIVSRKGIELDPSKIKAIQDLPPPKSRKDVMSFLGRLNYISRFIAQSTIICEPIFKLLRKDAAIKRTEDCQQAFDRIKEYLSSPPVLVPPKPGRPLLLYMSVSDNAFGCVLGQHDETGRKEQAIYYLIKKFTPYEARYTLLECTCCALTWVAQKLRHYLCAYTTFLISRMDPLKYIFQKPMPMGKLAKWQILLSEFDIIYVTQKAIKGQALADHLAENPVDEEYEPLKTYFPDEEVLFIGEDILEEYHGWRMFFDVKFKFLCTNNMAEYEACILGLRMAVDMNIQELLVIGDSDLLIHQVQGEWSTKNVKILPYLQCVKEICKKFIKIEFRHIPRAQNEFADALATMSSMIQHPDKNYIDPIKINVQNQPAYCFHVDEEMDGEPWYYDIVRYLKEGDYPEGISNIQKRTLRRLANHFFLSGEILYRRTPDLGLLRCVDSQEASKLIEEIHGGTCGPHMNGFTLAKKIVRAGYFWMTMEIDCIRFVRKSWGMDVIGPIELAASNGHRFILVAIDYFTKWVEASSHKSVTKKVVTDFIRNNIVCRFGIPHSIITDNGANLNSGLMHEICDKFKIIYRNSTPYRPQMNGAVEAANKNFKRLLVYGTEAVLPMEVEIPSLRIIQEAELSDAKWIQSRYEQLMLIDEKRMNAVCHGQLYQHRMAKAFNKKVRLRKFRPGQLVLKRIFPHQEEAKGKFVPNWHGPHVVHRVLTGGAVILAEMDGKIWPKAINSNAIKKYYV
ncbi:uncharacterized protein LOC129882003 [Solanum dulcamara]|uniref:uncharacterized protein LOC129882003 n=1 Tax=Solanum dulcamara TaxID=45834 RepID=UPI002484F9B5|nr:uncharacterized protein LOC129882003 [Solanum dulcamara]